MEFKRFSLSFVILLVLFSLNVFALTYRADVDNGTWSAYDSGLASSFYQSTTSGQTTYNRSFETDFTLGAWGVGTVSGCNGDWCASLNNNSYILRSNDFAQTGTYSAKIFAKANSTNIFYSNQELVGDSNVFFYVKQNSAEALQLGYFGYVNDLNTFYRVGDLNLTGTFVGYGFKIPSGSYRLAFYFAGNTSGNDIPIYIDNVQVLRNNTPTFRVNNVPQYCGTVEACSNQEYHLPSNQLGNTYAVVEYVAGATCTYSVTGGGSGAMTEGTSGMFYAPLDVAVTSNDYIDVNFQAQCSKVPYTTKNWFSTVRLYKYFNISNGNFETDFTLGAWGVGTVSGCNGDWCASLNNNSYILRSRDFAQDGTYSAKIVAIANSTNLFYPKTDYAGGNTVSFSARQNNTVNLIEFSYGYVDDSNTFTAVATWSDHAIPTDWNYYSYTIPSGSYRPTIKVQGSNALGTINVYIDNLISSGAKQASTLTASNDLILNFGLKAVTYNFYSAFKNSVGNSVTDATCTLYVDGIPQSMTYNSGTQKYATTYTFSTNGTYTIQHGCASSSFNDGNNTYSVTITTPASQNITFTPIENIVNYSLSNFAPIANISISNTTSDIIFSIINNSTTSNISLNWNNANDGTSKQYSVYTSSDGSTWTFNDTITFGASTSYNDPVQKLPTTNGHTYSFSASLPNGSKVYYKLVLNTLPLTWETIKGNANWVNVNVPTTYLDGNNKHWDLFADSNYTPIQSYTYKRFPDLTTTDFNSGFELQFTAYATTNTTLKVGYVTNGVQTTVNVPITTTQTRYSVPIDPTSDEARLLITSDGNNTQVYLTDYAIVPRAYFKDRLEVKNNDGTELNAILNQGTSKQYIREAVPFRIQTSAYDQIGDLKKLTVQAIIGNIVIKSQDFLLSDATSKDNVFTWDEAIEGFIDLNGTGSNPAGLRDVFIKATLYNNANQSVSEQITTVKILQYPYFPKDFVLNIEVLNSKLGTSPSIRFGVQQTISKYFLGIEVAIFDSSHTRANPNYKKTIFAQDLQCVNTYSCVKQITFDEYVYEGTGTVNYTIQVTGLLSTQNTDYTDSFTNDIETPIVTPSGYVLYQMKQYMERHQVAYPPTPYNNSERIPLILGVIDDSASNLSNTLSPYFTLDVNGVSYTTKFYPDAVAFDETTGNNMWLFNQYLYDDSGNLLPNDVNVKFRGVFQDKRSTHTVADTNFGFADRCTSYPLDLLGSTIHWAQTAWNSTGGEIFNWQLHNNDTGWVANFIGSIVGTFDETSIIKLNGCSAYPPAKVYVGGTGESLITIDNTYTPSADNRQALFCGQKYDNNLPIDVLGDDFECVLFVHEDEEQIDAVHIQLGNENSDFSVTNANKQYIDFTITANDIIFTDLSALIRNWNTSGHPTNSPTLQDIVVRFFHDNFTSQLSAEQIKANYKWTQLMGGDTNFDFYSDWNSSVFNKAIAFKVSGLSVINMRDYLGATEFLQVDPKGFLSYAGENKIKVTPKNATITIYNNASDAPYKTIETTAPFIITNPYSTPQKVLQDGNTIVTKTVPAQLKFKLTSTMLSANSTKQDRLNANLVFQYVIKAMPPTVPISLKAITDAIDGFFYGETDDGVKIGLFNNPMGFFMFNWFWILVIVGVLIVIAMVIPPFLNRGK